MTAGWMPARVRCLADDAKPLDGLAGPAPMRVCSLVVGTLVVAWSLSVPAHIAGASPAVSAYDVAYNHAPGLANLSTVDLIAVSSSDLGGPTINVSFAVSGKLSLQNPVSEYSYFVYFGGTNVRNGIAQATFSGPSPGSWTTLTSGSSAGLLPYTVGQGGASLNFSINKTVVGPPNTYSITACAWFTLDYPPGTSTYSCLGAIYPSGCGTAPTACATLVVKASEVGQTFLNGCAGPPVVVNFTGSASDGVPPYVYAWTFGDGSAGGAHQNVSHEYSTYGQYVVNLTVYDSLGAKGYSNLTASFTPPPCHPPTSPLVPAVVGWTLGVAIVAVAAAGIGYVIYLRWKH